MISTAAISFGKSQLKSVTKTSELQHVENILVNIILFVILTKSTIFSFMFLITPDLILTTVDLIMITMIFMMGIILRRGSNC